jgi:hypothetical protein
VAARFISLRRLIHEADAFDGQRITVLGYYDTNDGPTLSASTRAKSPDERVLLFPPRAAPASLQRTFVLVEGFFGRPSATSHGFGHLGDLVRFEPWSDPVKVREGRRPSRDDLITEIAPGPVTLRELVASPDTYHRELVRVSGFAAVRFEQHALFVDEEAYLNGLSKDAIWLGGERVEERFHEQHLIVAGTFDATKRGQLSAYSGTISAASCTVIERAEEAEAPAKPDEDDAWSPPSIPIPGHRKH